MSGDETIDEAEVIDVEGEEVTPATTDDPTVADLTPARIDHGALVTAAAPPDTIVAAFEEYQGLVGKLLVASDYQGIEGKQFKKKSAYRKLSVAFGVSFEILERVHDRDEYGRIIRSEFTVKAIAPNGRFMDGYGACSVFDRCKSHFPDCVTELDPDKPGRKVCTRHCGGREGGCDGFHHFSKPEHDVPATAETRAKNRAASDLFGMGEVSAEEVDTGDSSVRKIGEDRLRELLALAKGLREAGYEGEIGDRHTVLGVELTFVDPADGNVYIAATTADADALEQKIASLRAGLVGGEAQTAPAENAPASGPTTDAGAEPAEPEGDHPPEGSAPPPGDDGAAPVEPGSDGGPDAAEPGGTDAASEPAPTPEPEREKASRSDKTKLVLAIKGRWPDDPESKLARGAIVDIITNGRSRSSNDLYADEIGMAITAAKLLVKANLGFGVYPEGSDTAVLLEHGAVPAETDVATLLAIMPEGGTTEIGEAFLGQLAEFLGLTVEAGDAE